MVATTPVVTAPTIALREPTQMQLDGMENFAAVAAWAKMKGDVAHTPSQVGSMLKGLDCDEDIEIQEVAAFTVEFLSGFLRGTWMHSKSNTLNGR